MRKLNPSLLAELETYLYYFHVSELKEVCEQLQLSHLGKKNDLISRVLCYLKSGIKQELLDFPESSKTVKGKKYPLEPHAKILIGSYKNDLATRMFFKQMIGDHFHFTAFGIDWINERWLRGDPPTYEEFACFWKKEYELRKIEKVKPKVEWAYLSFIQRCLAEHPEMSKTQIIQAWKLERSGCIQKAKDILYGRSDS